MSHYRSNLRDIEFNLFEVLGRDAVLGHGLFEELDAETARSVLVEVDRLARTEIAASFCDGDRNPPTFDPGAHAVRLPASFKKSFHAYQEAEWFRLQLPAELGGQPAPASLQWSVAELVLGANPAVYLYSSGPNFAHMIWRNGTERDRRIAQLVIDRRWGASMVLTEPDAGSDVGAARAKAVRQPDGRWHIEGVKRFITSADHDLADNILHLVLARPAGVEGAGGPGTKGLSLFLVPKHLFDLETGELAARNGVKVTGLEHKMGIKVSSTCELTFGADEPAVGWLLGEVHDGIGQMFQIIEHARMLVGTKAIATLSTGYLNALDYARQRVQGPDLTQAADKTAPRVKITHHPDVRRSLLTQKATSEALRALVLYTATVQDRLQLAAADGRADTDARRLNDLLLPVVKGYGSEKSWTVLGTECLQTLGGSGFLTDYPLEQYVRDAKIDTLYEGTTAIQGQDLFFRKIVRDRGQTLALLAAQITDFITADCGNGQLKEERELLRRGLADLQAIVTKMTADLLSSQDHGGQRGEPRNIYKVGLNTSRLLMCLGDVICAWLMLRQAEVALGRLSDQLTEPDRHFYEGKLAAASWFVRSTMPGLAAERTRVELTNLDVMDLVEQAF